MKANHLVAKHRRSAVHFLRPMEVVSPLYGKMQANAVACGQALDAAGWASRATSQPHLVTCSACWPVANPPSSSGEDRHQHHPEQQVERERSG